MIQKILNISVFQWDLAWENPLANRLEVQELLSKYGREADLVILPEMFTTGFSMNAKQLAEKMDGETVNWMKRQSAEYKTALCGSLIVEADNRYFNRLIFCEPSGKIRHYDKRHLFTMGDEPQYFDSGSERIVVEYLGWRICPLICYDLRFPVWSRNRNEYDLLIYSANWPKSRDLVWNTLLPGRAIENQAYVAGANRTGIDGLAIEYSGNSQIISPKGTFLAGSVLGSKGPVVSAALSYSELDRFRKNFPVLNDADDFTVIRR